MCNNTIGSYFFACIIGYSGDGFHRSVNGTVNGLVLNSKAVTSVLVTTDSMVMMSPAVILTNALLLIIHTTKILSVPTLSVLTSVLVLMGTMVMDISAMTSTNAFQTLTTVMSVLEFAKKMMVL